MHVPKQAKKVFSGVIFDVYQWPQKMFDGSFETFEMLKRKHSIQVLAVTKDKKILTLKEQHPHIEKPFYGIIGGGQENDETPEETAKRELLEETGYTAENFELIDERYPSTKTDWPLYTFLAKNATKIKEQKLDSGEKVEVMEKDFDDFLEIATSDNFLSLALTYHLLMLNYKGKLEDFKNKILK